jgi:hypothetical protein
VCQLASIKSLKIVWRLKDLSIRKARFSQPDPERPSPAAFKLSQYPSTPTKKLSNRANNTEEIKKIVASTVSSSTTSEHCNPFQPTKKPRQSLMSRPNNSRLSTFHSSSEPECSKIVLPVASSLLPDSYSPTLSSPSFSSPDVSLPGAPSSPVSLTFSSSSAIDSSPSSPASPASTGPETFSSPSSSHVCPAFPLSSSLRSRHSALPADVNESKPFYDDGSPSPTGPTLHKWYREPCEYSLLQTTTPPEMSSESSSPSEVLVDQPMLTSFSLPGSTSDFDLPPVSASPSTTSLLCETVSPTPVTSWVNQSKSFPSLQVTSSSQLGPPCTSRLSDVQRLSSYGCHEATISSRPSSALPSPVMPAPSSPTISPLIFASPGLSPLLAYSHYDDSKTTAAEYAAAVVDSAWAFHGAEAVELGAGISTSLADEAGSKRTNMIVAPSHSLSPTPSEVLAPSIRNLPVVPPTSVIGKMKRLGGKVKNFFVLRSHRLGEGGFKRGTINVNVNVITANEEVNTSEVGNEAIVRCHTGTAVSFRIMATNLRLKLTNPPHQCPSDRYRRCFFEDTYSSTSGHSNSRGPVSAASLQTQFHTPHSLNTANPNVNKRTFSPPREPPLSASRSLTTQFSSRLHYPKILGKGKAMKRLPVKPVISHPRRLSLSGLANYNPDSHIPFMQEECSHSPRESPVPLLRSDDDSLDHSAEVDKALPSPNRNEAAKKNRRFSLSALSTFGPPSHRDFDNDSAVGPTVKRFWRRSLQTPSADQEKGQPRNMPIRSRSTVSNYQSAVEMGSMF